ncbi:hypothetical protein GDO78_017406 [Eleutherodactylus coqui]|uniref:Uncharacterized protein n=1 Tax=Eleutherodactylus coqui TaxID=57060 RepID=A0A8J6BF28_ELECQ|nr:hypothetical protein GDO78_017406 [Eleutherodactylus coqui]
MMRIRAYGRPAEEQIMYRRVMTSAVQQALVALSSVWQSGSMFYLAAEAGFVAFGMISSMKLMICGLV